MTILFNLDCTFGNMINFFDMVKSINQN